MLRQNGVKKIYRNDNFRKFIFRFIENTFEKNSLLNTEVEKLIGIWVRTFHHRYFLTVQRQENACIALFGRGNRHPKTFLQTYLVSKFQKWNVPPFKDHCAIVNDCDPSNKNTFFRWSWPLFGAGFISKVWLVHKTNNPWYTLYNEKEFRNIKDFQIARNGRKQDNKP